MDNFFPEPYSNVSYSIDFRLQSEIKYLFMIEEFSGRLLVDGDLERDKGTTYHEIEITLTDNNYGGSGQYGPQWWIYSYSQNFSTLQVPTDFY